MRSVITSICESSAYLNFVLVVLFNNLQSKKIKSGGDSSLSCGTPCLCLQGWLVTSSSLVFTTRQVRNLLSSLNRRPFVPAVHSLSNNPLCQTLSNAFSRSRLMRAAFCLSLIASSCSILSWYSERVVLFLGKKPSCSWSPKLLIIRTIFSLLSSILSNTLRKWLLIQIDLYAEGSV